jgi:hypothetical protein
VSRLDLDAPIIRRGEAALALARWAIKSTLPGPIVGGKQPHESACQRGRRNPQTALQTHLQSKAGMLTGPISLPSMVSVLRVRSPFEHQREPCSIEEPPLLDAKVQPVNTDLLRVAAAEQHGRAGAFP